MTEQTNADIIAWLLRAHTFDLSPLGHDYTDAQVADALEAADQRAELAEADLSVEESKNAGYRAKNNQLAAVVEKVRGSIPLENPELIEAGYTVPAEDLIDYLATAPTDALSELKADVWDEGFDAGFAHGYGDGTQPDKRSNPYRKAQS